MDTYEKKYKEALERARDLHDGPTANVVTRIFLEQVFPELRENEEERIRGRLIQVVSAISGGWPFETYGITKKEAIAYLEKQKESKSIEDKDLSKCSEDIQEFMEIFCEDQPKAYWDGVADTLEWIKEHPDNQFVPKPAEWSEEDELMRTVIIQTLERFGGRGTTGMQIDWLKSLRPQPHWKPSEEQMNCLCASVDAAIRKHNESVSGYKPARVLKSLYEQLKKLM